MRFAVIGAGNTGQTMAAHLVMMGHKVKLFDRNEEKVEKILKSGIELNNAICGRAIVQATTNMEDAIVGAEFIMITTTAQGHSAVCKLMKDFLEYGQTIIVFHGNWGAIEFKTILAEKIEEKNIIIAETGSMIYICNSPEPGSVNVKQIKNRISLSSIPSEANKEIIKRLKNVYPQLTAANSVLETSINNSNTLIHTPITIFNACRINSKHDFTFYGEGASPLSIRYIELMDEERLKIGRAMGIETMSVLEIINSFWTNKHDHLYDALHLNKSYKIVKAPKSLNHRYIYEDIPYGLVPLSKLGKAFQIETPYIDGLINIASLLLSRDFMEEGPNLAGLDILKVQSEGYVDATA